MKLKEPSGVPLTLLRYVGAAEGFHCYAKHSDATAVLPPPPAPPMESFPPTLNGVYRYTTDVADIVITDRWIDGPKRAIEFDAGCDVTNMRVERVKFTNVGRDGARLRNGSNVTFRDFEITKSAVENLQPETPVGITFTGVTNFLVENGTIRGFRMAQEYRPDGTSIYRQGDGFGTEGGSQGTIRNLVVEDSTDRNLDLKGTVHLENVTSRRSKRNFGFWHNITGTNITSENPTGTHIWVGDDAVVELDEVTAIGVGKPVFTMESRTRIHVKKLITDVPASLHKRSNGSANTCQIDLIVYV
ncbi:right-handed parallel beta-helix repeat-containing protein [Allosphingosinicella deserti]|uniref:right-handed parallel beta-helix repeat-containing protein n=1 Tax=Allosphingosinicella deserti TaxID=2116704 RepID=UPI0011B27ECC|nr:right-handed parallel beta-helix repeat-containing protein [Sphingomonas deserti]